jgi:glycerol kinase
VETTVLGAAFAAGLAVGVWKNIDALPKLNTRQFKPLDTAQSANDRMQKWKDAIERSLNQVK